MNNFPKRYLQWVTSQMNGDQESAKKYCRKYWDQYGERIVKRACNEKSCTSLIKFEVLCKEIDKFLKIKH